MTDPDDISVDDLVMEDELDKLRDEFQEEIEKIEAGDGGVDTDDIHDVADQTFVQRMEHILDEDCDSEVCNHFREELDVDAGTDADGGADPDDDTPTDQPSGGDNPEADADADDEPEESESSDEDPDDSDDEPETNIFGEPV